VPPGSFFASMASSWDVLGRLATVAALTVLCLGTAQARGGADGLLLKGTQRRLMATSEDIVEAICTGFITGAEAIKEALREGDVDAVADGLVEALAQDKTTRTVSAVVYAYGSLLFDSELRDLLVEAVALALTRQSGGSEKDQAAQEKAKADVEDALMSTNASSMVSVLLTGSGSVSGVAESEAEARKDVVEAVAKAISGAASQVAGGADAKAVANSTAEAIGTATATAIATASGEVDVEGAGEANATAEANAIAIAEVTATAFVRAIANVTNNNTDAVAIAEAEVTTSTLAEAVATARIDVDSTAGIAKADAEAVAVNVAKVVVKAIAFALAVISDGVASSTSMINGSASMAPVGGP